MRSRPGFQAAMILAIVLSMAIGCSRITGRTASHQVDDATITQAVKGKLVADSASSLSRVDVDTNRGTVYLNGTVQTPEQKAKAEELAWQATGVKSVVNNLQVQRR